MTYNYNFSMARRFTCLLLSATLISLLFATSTATAFLTGNTSHGVVAAASDGSVVAGKIDFSVGSVLYLLKVDAAGNEVWTKTYGEYSSFGEVRSLAAADDGYLLVSTLPTSNGSCLYLLKTDLSGNQVWDKTYGEPNLTYYVTSAIAVPDGFVLTGNAGPFPWHGVRSYPWDTTYHTFLIKTDSDGNLAWYHLYDSEGYDRGNAVMATADGYVIAGSYSTSHEGATTYVIKTDPSGNEVWNFTRETSSSGEVYSIAPASDGYLFSGISWFYHPNMIGPGRNAGYLVDVAPDGQVCQEYFYHITDWADRGRFIEPVGNSYLIAGTADVYGNRSLFLFETDLAGTKSWYKTYPGIRDELSGMVAVSDGCVMAGPANLKGYWQGYDRMGATGLHLFKADSNGNIVWDRTYESMISRDKPVGPPGTTWTPSSINVSPLPLSTPAAAPAMLPGLSLLSSVIAVCVAALLIALRLSLREHR